MSAPEAAPGEQKPSAAMRLIALLQRHRWLLPLLGFVFGWTSYVLVDRGSQHVARAIAAIALLGWPWLLAESALGQWLERRSSGVLAVGAVRYLTQSLQLEILFFSLPFLIGASQLDAGHIAFTTLAALAALICSIDPLYSRFIANRPFSSILFHAYCSFIGALVMLPVAAQLGLETSLPLALTVTGLLLLLSLPRALMQASPWQRVLRLTVLAVIPALVWGLRAHIPAAALRVSEARLTQSLSGPLVPGPAFSSISTAELHAAGAIAFAAVRTPVGLSQSVEFVWLREGEVIDRIPAAISGGREAGYRLYSRKHSFPEDPRGRWTVDLIAPDRRLIYRWHFSVI